MESSARMTNVKARVFTHFADLSLHGAPLLVFDGQNAATDDVPAWVRLTVIPSTEDWSGHQTASYRAMDSRALLVADVFVADGAAQGEAFDAYWPDRIADDLRDAMRALSLSFIDYSSDPDNPTTRTDARIRAIDLPRSAPLPKDGPWLRRQVTTELRWISTHTA